jgi:hypothetical protein
MTTETSPLVPAPALRQPFEERRGPLAAADFTSRRIIVTAVALMPPVSTT